MRISRRTVVTGTVAAAIAPSAASARAAEIYMNEGGVFGRAWDFANDGHDVVAYHSLPAEAAPIQGDASYSASFKGVEWLFATAANRDAFIENPDKYRPQYGNYCAWAMARGKLAMGDPQVWHIKSGRLFLNVSKRIKKEWLANIDRDISAADANWPAVLDKS